MFWIALAAWSLVLPVGVSPDEDFHQTMIYCASGKDARCRVDGARVGHCYSMLPFVAASCSSDAQLTFPAATKIDWNAYPPLYYSAMHLFVGKSLGATTRNVRLANLTLALLLALLSVSLSHPNCRRAVAIAWLLCSVPLGIFFISSISPSAWAIMSVAALWGPLLTMFCREQNPFVLVKSSLKIDALRALFILGVMVLGLGSRGEPFIFIPLVFAVVAIYWFAGKSESRGSIVKIALSLFLAMLIMLSFTQLFDQVLIKINNFSNQDFFLALQNYFLHPHWRTFYLTVNTLLGMLSFVGIPGAEIGTHDVPTPAFASFLVAVAFGGSFLMGLAWMDRKKALCILFLIFSVFFIVSFLWSAAIMDVYQSRYFLPILYPILGFALLPITKNSAVFNHLQWLVIFICIGFANCIYLISAELRFLYGATFQITRYPLNKEFPDVNPARLLAAEIPNWWIAPDFLSPFILWVVGSTAFFFALLLFHRWIVTPIPQKSLLICGK